MQKYSMKSIAPTVAQVLDIKTPSEAREPAISQIVADLTGVKKIAILAPDALGILPWNLWKDEMPYLKELHERRSITLESILPSSTPMNFTCMLTGAEMEVHGVENREMDIRCETLYDVVRQAGGSSAGIGIEGYTGDRVLARYADHPGIAAKSEWADTVGEMVMKVVNEHAPTFLIAQIGNVDTLFHKVGPADPSVVPMLQELDRVLAELIPFLTGKGYGVIQLADHGQRHIPATEERPARGVHGTDAPEDRLVPCTWIK